MLTAVIVEFSVGQPYDPDRPGPMPETPHLLITGTNVVLSIAYQGLMAREVRAFTYGEVRFAWVDSEQVALLAFKLGDLPWADCPFDPKLVTAEGWERPRLEPAGHAMLMILIEADTGIVAAMRVIGLAGDFVAAMAATVRRMLVTPYDVAAHDAALDALYERYATPEELVRRRADVTCVGARPGSALPGTGEDAN